MKVFCIDFQKTGTSTLDRALKTLGLSVAGYHPFRPFAADPDVTFAKLWQAARPIAHADDAVQDTPWSLLYRELHQEFPDARFIHVVRDEQSWIKSATRDFRKHGNEIHRLIYGTENPVGNEDAWVSRYRRHNREVADYFKSLPDQYLRIELEGPDYGWPAICDFLGQPEPQTPWPHANKAGTKERKALLKRNLIRLKRLFA